MNPELLLAYLDYEVALRKQDIHKSPEAQKAIATNIGEAVLDAITEDDI
ncbi:hypothetical protein UFOVP585_7 [uncultured Caudovirales phage]|uniref:Uncharacterized protein n=1 Tax=uncultured Caudovirales phage TaxID=2100421 RepID=A0A6J5N1Y6_9CAUD|nr:hypothetical protein UFOVP585_7 [uncultured Caudovirales phage]